MHAFVTNIAVIIGYCHKQWEWIGLLMDTQWALWGNNGNINTIQMKTKFKTSSKYLHYVSHAALLLLKKKLRLFFPKVRNSSFTSKSKLQDSYFKALTLNNLNFNFQNTPSIKTSGRSLAAFSKSDVFPSTPKIKILSLLVFLFRTFKLKKDTYYIILQAHPWRPSFTYDIVKSVFRNLAAVSFCSGEDVKQSHYRPGKAPRVPDLKTIDTWRW